MTSFDVLIVGGTLVDGTGRAGVRADVGMQADRVAAIGDLTAAEGRLRIDARDRVVCPGFIDAHSHSDLSLLSDGRAVSKIHQGVTTEIVGNCGLAVAPLADRSAVAGVREAIHIVDPDPSVTWDWRSVREYLERLESAGVSLNVAALAGHLAIHASIVGYANRPPTAEETGRMQALLDEAFADGAVGLSTGLMYAPIAYADLDELVALGEVAARYQRVFALHMRNYADQLLEALDEALAVGRAAGCRVQASHLAVAGQRNWGKCAEALRRMDAARAQGVPARADIYPYLAGSANLSQLLPGWAHEGGTRAMLERLRNARQRQRIRDEWQTTLVQHWQDVLICWVRGEGNQSIVGKRVSEIAAERGAEPDDTALDLIAAEHGLVNMIAFGRSEDDLLAVLRHSETLIGSDGLAVDPAGRSGSGHPHPRYYGCYPRLLSHYVRDQAMLSLEDAIHRSSGLVAETFGLPDRGVLRVGAAADALVLDIDGMVDRATFLEPQRLPSGFEAVIVNGTLVVDHDQHTGARPGRVLRAT